MHLDDSEKNCLTLPLQDRGQLHRWKFPLQKGINAILLGRQKRAKNSFYACSQLPSVQNNSYAKVNYILGWHILSPFDNK